jgi:pilus assembly protein Flp/PilA
MKWYHPIQRFWQDEQGPTAVEYAVMLALIVVVCMAAITTLGQNANTKFLIIQDALHDAITGQPVLPLDTGSSSS